MTKLQNLHNKIYQTIKQKTTIKPLRQKTESEFLSFDIFIIICPHSQQEINTTMETLKHPVTLNHTEM